MQASGGSLQGRSDSVGSIQETWPPGFIEELLCIFNFKICTAEAELTRKKRKFRRKELMALGCRAQRIWAQLLWGPIPYPGVIACLVVIPVWYMDQKPV